MLTASYKRKTIKERKEKGKGNHTYCPYNNKRIFLSFIKDKRQWIKVEKSPKVYSRKVTIINLIQQPHGDLSFRKF